MPEITDWYRIQGPDLLLSLRIQPRASREGIDGLQGGRLRVRISAPPVEGAANERLVQVLAKQLEIPRSALVLTRGKKGRDKEILVKNGASRHLELIARLVS